MHDQITPLLHAQLAAMHCRESRCHSLFCHCEIVSLQHNLLVNCVSEQHNREISSLL